MNTSLFEIFKIGIGQSSSHTVGPMRAAGAFVTRLKNEELFESVWRVRTVLYGSLALTGIFLEQQVCRFIEWSAVGATQQP